MVTWRSEVFRDALARVRRDPHAPTSSTAWGQTRRSTSRTVRRGWSTPPLPANPARGGGIDWRGRSIRHDRPEVDRAAMDRICREAHAWAAAHPRPRRRAVWPR